MTIERKLRIDDRFSWSFVGFIVGLLGVLITVGALYSTLRENHPDIVYEIENESDVFDLHRPLQDLTLSFRGEDVQQQNLNLRILTVRVWNRGSKDILQDQYDQSDAWGLKVEPGQVIEVRVGENNSDYLASHIGPRITAESTVVLNKVILEHDKFVTLDILVLHHKNLPPPNIVAFGKIAGLDKIVVLDASGQRGKPGFWTRVFSGTLLVNLVRFVISIILLIITIFALIGVSALKDKLSHLLRRRRIRAVEKNASLNPKVMKIFEDSYIRSGISGLRYIQETLTTDEDVLAKALSHHLSSETINDDDDEAILIHSELSRSEGSSKDVTLRNQTERPVFRVETLVPFSVGRLAHEGFITITDDKHVHIAPEVEQALKELLKRLA